MVIWIPIIASLSAFALCITQNMMNVLQAKQSKISQWRILIFSVGLSLHLGTFVTAGIALYWTTSNLFAILQQWPINPKKHVDYAEFETPRKEPKRVTRLKRSSGG